MEKSSTPFENLSVPSEATIAEIKGELLNGDPQNNRFTQRLIQNYDKRTYVPIDLSKNVDVSSNVHNEVSFTKKQLFQLYTQQGLSGWLKVFLMSLRLPLNVIFGQDLPPLEPKFPLSKINALAWHTSLPIVIFAEVSSQNNILFYDVASSAFLKQRLQLPPNAGFVTAMHLTKQNYLYVGTSSGRLFEWKLSFVKRTSSAGATKRVNITVSILESSGIDYFYGCDMLLGGITSLTCTIDGFHLIIGTRRGVWLYNTVLKQPGYRLCAYACNYVGFSGPQHSILTVVCGKLILLFSCSTFGVGLSLSFPAFVNSSNTVESVAWLAGEKTLLYSVKDVESIQVLNVTSHQLSDMPPTYIRSTPICTPFVKSRGYGGAVSQLCVDPKSKRLVVSFDKTPYLAVFSVDNGERGLFINPVGLVKGPTWRDSTNLGFPAQFSFCRSFLKGALLLTSWESGQLVLTPFYFATENKLHW
ncbi:hypothetical protein SJAG_03716 [Schizosaccharomyces japonicus yFS275]|uniref:Uncharacterized protein n=1 Tax=Schizosaccharomyces japonicus (strain yFS275 / FY16936) TaxID=402676 RepID=B6K501_SCHJY|nr:hypothetical protein SJAG_03716 [Schizosaccharomyces japonicus yFS275]EEB08558.1 hypothetical protein SJAG_03716 [Schizosaccharomyces japonicus yFS275]